MLGGTSCVELIEKKPLRTDRRPTSVDVVKLDGHSFILGTVKFGEKALSRTMMNCVTGVTLVTLQKTTISTISIRIGMRTQLAMPDPTPH